MFVPELPLSGIVLAAAGRTVTVAKPEAGTPVVYRMEPGDTLNLQPIANESVTLVKLGNRLVVLFPDRGFIVLDGLYLTDGSASPDVSINFAPGTTLNAVQFTAQFPITTDTEILTAAGINVGPLGSGGINLAAAPPGSSLQPIPDLTPGTDINGQVFGTLPPSSFAGNTTAFGTTPPGVDTPILPLAAANDGASVSESGVQPGNTPFAGTPSVTGSVLANDAGTSPFTLVGVEQGVVSSASGNLGAAITGTYGTMTLAADGTYTYVLNNADGDTDALAQGQSVQEVFTYTIQDNFGQFSTAQLVITVVGTNDAPIITVFSEEEVPSGAEGAPSEFSTVFGTVIEAGSNKAGPTPGIQVATGQVEATDVDNGAVLTWSGNARGTYGDFTIDPVTGAWTYTLDNDDPDTQALTSGDVVQEQFTVTVTDEFGATDTTVVRVTVFGADDETGPKLDLDTTTAGVDYRGLTEVEAARSVAFVNPANGVTIVQTNDGVPPAFQYSADFPGARLINVSLADTTTGFRGYVGLAEDSPLFSNLSFVNRAGFSLFAHSIQLAPLGSLGAGLTQAQIDAFIQNLRYVNTETTFALDTSDREVVVTLVDADGVTHTATAFIPVVADVSDTTGLNAFTGTQFSDRILGLDGDDIIDGGEGDNVIDGGVGDNLITVGNGDNWIDGGVDDDEITAGDGNNLINAGDGDNEITVGDGINTINAGSGGDEVTTGNGDNTISVGDGDNTVTTGSGDDVVLAGDGDNLIDVGAGDDEVYTGAGDDRINLGSGDNRVDTGSGADTLVFNTALSDIGANTIVGFESGFDTLELDFSIFGSNLATGGADTGTLDVSRFISGTSFTNTTQRFLFDTSSNTLFFDADGAGGSSSIELAKLESGGTITATDIRLA